MNENTISPRRKRIDERLIYLIPAAAALCFAFASLMMQFGNVIVDMENTCYYLYVSTSGETEESFADKVGELVEKSELNGFTINRNLRGGYKKDGKLVIDRDSYMIILLEAQKKHVTRFAADLIKTFGPEVVLVEEVVMSSYYMTSADVQRNKLRLRDFEDINDADDVLLD